MSENGAALSTYGAVAGGIAVVLVVAIAGLGVSGALPGVGDASPPPVEEPPHSTPVDMEDPPHSTPVNMSTMCNESDLHTLPAETEKSESGGDQPPTNDSDNDTAPRNIDSKRDVKRQLLAEFEVGTCSGMPTVITDDQVTNGILNHSELTAYIVVHHNATSQERIYEYIQQYENIHVENVGGDTYEFRIRDGECCAVTTINGTYNMTTDSITVTNKTTERMPC